jgi:hypothetical protein
VVERDAWRARAPNRRRVTDRDCPARPGGEERAAYVSHGD